MKKDILICGVGGQGTVLASRIIAASAMDEGNTVHSAETIGMAQRGGPVTSHVRIGEDASSPLIPLGCADLLIAFEPSEAVRNLRYLKKDGFVIVNSVPVRPTTLGGTEDYDGKRETEFVRSRFQTDRNARRTRSRRGKREKTRQQRDYEQYGGEPFFHCTQFRSIHFIILRSMQVCVS